MFPALNHDMDNPCYATYQAVLSTKNDIVDGINIHMIERFPSEEMIWHSFESANGDPHVYYLSSFLIHWPNGIPSHTLKMKINFPIILPMNINPANGLCNGTWLV